jgi:hypothetical protein
MIVLLAVHLVLILIWIGAAMTLPRGAPDWTFPLVLALHALMGGLVLRMGRPEITLGGFSRRLINIPLLCVPPAAPVVMCLLVAGITLRAGQRWGSNEEARSDLLRLSSRWRVLGGFGVAMAVIWGWGYAETALSPAAGVAPHPWLDPLTSFRAVLSTPLQVTLLVLTAVYVRLMLITLRALGLHRRLWAEVEADYRPSPPAS